MRRKQLSAAQARRIAMAAQGFDRVRPAGAVDARHFRRVIDRLGLLQLDYVNVLVPAHLLVLWSRLGAFDRTRFERFVYARGAYTEQWAHEASIVPARCWPWFEHRRRAHRLHNYNPLRKLRNRRAYLDAVLDQVRRDGALTAADLPQQPGPRRKPGDWHRSMPRWALEYHFARGALAVARRQPNFQRVYDLPERVLPREHLEHSMSKADAQREALRHAANATGVGTLQDLADYYRMSPRECAPRVAELVEEGVLTEVGVEGWKNTAFLARDARLPRSIRGASLLSPFDPLVWFRPRTERLFDFHYRIEIYVPAHKRKWGYYVLPFRVGDRIVARVDLKANRAERRLIVRAVHEEPGDTAADCVERLAAELQALGRWLDLDDILVKRHNDFSRRLAAAV
jgi:uncharacterized protein